MWLSCLPYLLPQSYESNRKQRSATHYRPSLPSPISSSLGQEIILCRYTRARRLLGRLFVPTPHFPPTQRTVTHDWKPLVKVEK